MTIFYIVLTLLSGHTSAEPLIPVRCGGAAGCGSDDHQVVAPRHVHQHDGTSLTAQSTNHVEQEHWPSDNGVALPAAARPVLRDLLRRCPAAHRGQPPRDEIGESGRDQRRDIGHVASVPEPLRQASAARTNLGGAGRHHRGPNRGRSGDVRSPGVLPGPPSGCWRASPEARCARRGPSCAPSAARSNPWPPALPSGVRGKIK
jgi:hypothetical protein